MQKALIQLGRYGDICNVLPLLEENNRNGKRVALCVSRSFADVFDGISYADRLVYSGADNTPLEAARRARLAGYEPAISQCHGEGIQQERICDTFCREQWRKVGREERWEQLSLFFDRRSEEREDKLATQVDWTRPVVLHNGAGFSSPFPGFSKFISDIAARCPEFSFVDLSKIKAEKFFDLLGLYDRAHALVTVDTMTLHLAKASPIPVIALHNHAAWLGSPRTANHLRRRSYKDADPDEIAAALRLTLEPTGRVVHTYPVWKMSEEDARRLRNAEETWTSECPDWVRLPFDNENADRDSAAALGDAKPVPFVRDVLAQALKRTKKANDIVVISNSDIGLSRGAATTLARMVGTFGSGFAYRFNFDSPPGLCSRVKCTSGYWDGGLDLFAFRRDWLKEHLATLPDMVMGRTHWDLVYRHIVKQTGGADLTGLIWHERHKSFWTQHAELPGNKHNLAISKEFFSRNDPTRPYRWTFDECRRYRNR